MISLTDMQYLVALAQENHFGRASAKCNVSQPAMSAAIAKLEEKLNIVLCERLGRGIYVTAECKALAAASEKVIAQVSNIISLANYDKDQLSYPIHLGSEKYLGSYLFPQLMLHLSHRQKTAQIHLQEKNSDELFSLLKNISLDAILVVNAKPRSHCVIRELFSEPWQLLVPLSHPLSNKPVISCDDLKNTPLFINEADETLIHLGLNQQQLNQQEPSQQKWLLEKTSSLEVLRGLVAAQIGLGLVPFIAANSQLYAKNQWACRSIEDLPPRKISLAWRTSYPRYKMMEFLAQNIKVCAEWNLNFVAHAQHPMLGFDSLQPPHF
jgi:LysR family transcriptional regulator, hydrogen peroxide-inducible genes activator